MRILTISVGVLLIVGLWSGGVFAASKEERIEDLRRQIEELTQQAEQYRSNIFEKQSQAATLERDISILNNRISGLQREINITSAEIETAEIQILTLEEQIFETTQTIAQHKASLGDLINEMYRRDNMSMVSLLLGSNHISDFANEAQRIQTVKDRLDGLVRDLKVQKIALEDAKATLQGKKTDLEYLNDQHLSQRGSLSSSRNQKDNILDQTKGEEAEYQKLLSDAEKKKAQFFAEIQALESEARETGSFIVHVTASSVPPAGTELFRWPYDNFVLTQGYGMTSYARRGTYGGRIHNGVDVVAGHGSPIKSIGDGHVLTAGYNSGYGNWVAIQHHNNMVSLYAHMSQPARLGNGTEIKAGDVVGFEGSTGFSTGSHLHFSIYREFFTYIRQSNGQMYFNYSDGNLNPFNYLPDL